MGMAAAGFVTGAGSTTLPLCALVGGTTGRLHIRQIGIWNTTTTACGLVLARLSTAGTPGASATSRLLDGADVQNPIGVLKNTYTSTAPTTTELGIGFYLGAAIGSGVILPFERGELTVPTTANAAIGILVDTGSTGQACRVYVKWEET